MADHLKASARDSHGPVKLISGNDVVTALAIVISFLCALCFPRSAWPAVSGHLGRLHRRLKPGELAATVATVNEAGLRLSETELREGLLTGTYLENIEAMSEYLGFRKPPDIDIKGLEHVRRALELKRGVILWCAPCCGSQAVSLRAYSQAGLAVTRVQSGTHPYSETRFGLTVLNRIRTRVEYRHLAGSVLLTPDSQRTAPLDVMRILRNNGIVQVTAVGSGEDPMTIPFLGGTLALARGVPKIANATGATVIPVWFSLSHAPRYVMEFDAPLETAKRPADDDRDRPIADAFVRWFADRLRKEPHCWLGWALGDTWVPRQPS